MHKAKGFFVTLAIAGLSLGAPPALAADRESLDARFQQAKPVACDVQCGDVITQHTKLTHDLSCPGLNEPALRVEGDGIVLDLGGYTVRRSGPDQGGTSGIVVTSGSYMVRNGTIRGFDRGIQTFGTNNLRLHELTFADNFIAVFNLVGNAFLVTDSRFIGNTIGFTSGFEVPTGTLDVRSSHFENNGSAIIMNSLIADVLDSTFTSNGVTLDCFNGRARVRSSVLTRNQVVARAIDPAGQPNICGILRFEDSLFTNNTSFGPADAPVWVPTQLDMINNLLVGNGSGLEVATLTTYVQGNTFWNNAGGLTLSDYPNAFIPLTGIVRANQFLRNDGDGLRVLPPSTPTVIGNVALGNTGWGIHAPTAFDGGGNVARDNGAGNCEGIVCAPY
ncbi:right-handed parallel beta-helix repeat-containing protein [Corallococcus exiguus]|uniref:right-handed parallel beta-helix repeat-containing protein n=1 Tax=Corallococcus exiguus TaxID=83462 RepID=UPI001A8F360A|nr:right-handed parallel beta-helix repeat-containing protein [Corallococcus exiguus]MBN8467265.1 right-handed parallel beta-helix repeat-containing protein [Corallococcus exiguus]